MFPTGSQRGPRSSAPTVVTDGSLVEVLSLIFRCTSWLEGEKTHGQGQGRGLFGIGHGFGAGLEQSLQNPLGKRGSELHQWIFDTRYFHEMTGREDGDADSVDQAYAWLTPITLVFRDSRCEKIYPMGDLSTAYQTAGNFACAHQIGTCQNQQRGTLVSQIVRTDTAPPTMLRAVSELHVATPAFWIRLPHADAVPGTSRSLLLLNDRPLLSNGWSALNVCTRVASEADLLADSIGGLIEITYRQPRPGRLPLATRTFFLDRSFRTHQHRSAAVEVLNQSTIAARAGGCWRRLT